MRSRRRLPRASPSRSRALRRLRLTYSITSRRISSRTALMNAPVRELSYAQAIHEAMAIAMEEDSRVFLMGEDIGVYGGAFQVTGDLVNRFGTDRVMDTPI